VYYTEAREARRVWERPSTYTSLPSTTFVDPTGSCMNPYQHSASHSYTLEALSRVPTRVKLRAPERMHMNITRCLGNGHTQLHCITIFRSTKARTKCAAGITSMYNPNLRTRKHQAILLMSPSDKSKLCNAPPS